MGEVVIGDAGGLVLDIRTLFMTLVLVASLLSGLMVLSWHAHRRIAALAWWAGASGVFSVGVLLLALRGLITDFASVWVANVLIMGGLALMWLGIRRFAERPLPLRLAAGLLAAFALALGLMPLGPEGLALRITLCAATICTLCCASAFELFRRHGGAWVTAGRLTGLLFLTQALFQGGRAVAALVQPPHGSFMQYDTVTGLSLLLTTLELVALNFGFLFMTTQRLQAELDAIAAHDGLTQLLNRRAFLDAGGREFARARRTGQALSALMMDIDHFKAINDGYGHHAGDMVLRRFAELLRQNLREQDLVCRYGGEEFCALLPDADAGAARVVAERIRAAFAAAAVEDGGRAISTTVSIGLTRCQGACGDLGALIRTADRALYAAKAGGRDRIAEAPCQVAAAAC